MIVLAQYSLVDCSGKIVTYVQSAFEFKYQLDSDLFLYKCRSLVSWFRHQIAFQIPDGLPENLSDRVGH